MTTQTCTVSGKTFEITDEDLAFYKKMELPTPQINPLEYLRWAMSCRNEQKLYMRECDKSGRMIISAYHKEVPFPVYSNEAWWSDSWDGLEYGQDYDFSKPFFDQLKTLQEKVPREGTSVFNSENCDYNGHIRASKNCYLCSLIYNCEDCYYNYWVGHDTNVVDSYFVLESELCYECINCQNCFDCIKLQESKNCNECLFSFHLQGCDHCIGCSNLQHKSYYILNKPVSKEVFERTKHKLINGNQTGLEEGEKMLQKIRTQNHHRAVFNLNCENVFGDNLRDCKNCYYCFLGDKSEDCKYCVSLNSSKDVHSSYAVNVPNANELIFTSSVVRGSHNIAFSYYIWNSQDLRYSDSCLNCKHCFGCIGLKHKSYCILNKQYTQEAYFEHLPRIKKHLKQTGEDLALPLRFPSFAYNETAAQTYFELTKDEVLNKGYRWHEDDTSSKYIGEAYQPPANIQEVDDAIIEKILTCKQSGKNFKIQKMELKFYKQMGLPIPRLHPDIRHEKRIKLRNPRQLWERQCHECQKTIQTTFAPDRPEKVLCEGCYLTQVQ